MRLIKPSYEIMSVLNVSKPLALIEAAGRTCYKSEDKITKDSNKKFVEKILNLDHESVLEHSAMTVRFICDRGVSHELVRHRLASFSQESTRYCKYKDEVTFIIPPWVDIVEGCYPATAIRLSNSGNSIWFNSLVAAEKDYLRLLNDHNWVSQQARSVLPNSLKTEIVCTTNFREWRHIFKLRTSPAAHPQMRELMLPLLNECKQLIPVVFDDIKN
jgi:thymidylate synthase (FAD)